MSQGISETPPTILNCETVCDQRGEVVREIDPLTLPRPTTLGGFVQRGRTASRAVGSREAFFGKGHRETEQVYPPIPWDRTQLLPRSGKRGFSITPRGGEG
ncbi:unnamed protein product [Brassica napus]|uniref:(rape) hypothetical protein n=1 Tax=Brassica napus TaxID=3708 RepID=A0A816SR68_BRANA|nr:unnamed protein product [Brassica napus]CAF2086570.1 unnamed protein product [Brassica napus]